jgi:hypothetical protein
VPWAQYAGRGERQPTIVWRSFMRHEGGQRAAEPAPGGIRDVNATEKVASATSF